MRIGRFSIRFAQECRIVTSSLNRQKPEQTTASISFEVPAADADATLAEIRRDREVMMLTVRRIRTPTM